MHSIHPACKYTTQTHVSVCKRRQYIPAGTHAGVAGTFRVMRVPVPDEELTLVAMCALVTTGGIVGSTVEGALNGPHPAAVSRAPAATGARRLLEMATGLFT